MLPKLQKDKKFLLDIKNYKLAIEKIQNEKIKNNYKNILQKLLKNAETIDKNHDSSYNIDINTASLKNIVLEMIDQRRSLDKLYKDTLDNR